MAHRTLLRSPARIPDWPSIGIGLLVLLPSALTTFLAFDAGGFFPASNGAATLVVAQALLIRVVAARRPMEGHTRWSMAACGLLAGYVTWGLVSSVWSDAPGRALHEAQRGLLCLLLLTLYSSVAWTRGQLRAMATALAATTAAICAVALATRLMPDVVSSAPNVANSRLSFPLTYWNALGFMAALALVLTLREAGAGRSRVRLIAAASVPITTTTLYFTFSRGAILAAALGLGTLLVAARSWRATVVALAVSLPTAIVLRFAYAADLLAAQDVTGPAAVSQGHRLALIVLAGSAGAAALTVLAGRIPVPRLRPTRRQLAVVAAVAGAGAVAMAFALGAPGAVRDGVERFGDPDPAARPADLRERLASPANQGRVDHWRVAVEGFAANPLKGNGLGTYELLWARDRHEEFSVVNAHSLYLETLSEVGIVGGLLLLGSLALIVAALAARTRSRDRTLFAALLAGGLAWAFQSGIDWLWQMPATGAWLFALGGAALSGGAGQVHLGALGRLLASAACAAIIAAAGMISLADRRLVKAVEAFHAGHCDEASRAAASSASLLGVRTQPYLVMAFCALDGQRPGLAVRAMQEALRVDPRSWETHYGLALAQAESGGDPTTALDRARKLNPREQVLRDAVRDFAGTDAVTRASVAREARAAWLQSGHLSIGSG